MVDEEDEEDLDPERVVRIRRGSEGYEVRPRLARPPPDGPSTASRGSTSTDEDGWERVEQKDGSDSEAFVPSTTEGSLRRRPSQAVNAED